MNDIERHIRRSMMLKTVAFCITTALICAADTVLIGKANTARQAVYLVIVSVVYLLLSAAGYSLYRIVMKKGGKKAIGFYMLGKVLRLFVTIAILLIYALADCRNLLAFAMSVLALYLVSMVTSIIFYVKVEQGISKKQ